MCAVRDTMKTVAIIPAGGSGSRMGMGVPKQYLPLAGIPLLVHTLRVFQHSALIDDILLVVPEADVPNVRTELVEKFGLTHVSLVLAGGARRQDSVRNALFHVREDHEIVIVHDGARPFVTDMLISRVVAAAETDGAAVAGIKIKDTVKDVAADGWLKNTVPRDGLWLAQTPQAFRRELILAAYSRAAAEGFHATDDASLVERMGGAVRMIPGDDDNIKVTTPADMARGETLIRRTFPPAGS